MEHEVNSSKDLCNKLLKILCKISHSVHDHPLDSKPALAAAVEQSQLEYHWQHTSKTNDYDHVAVVKDLCCIKDQLSGLLSTATSILLKVMFKLQLISINLIKPHNL